VVNVKQVLVFLKNFCFLKKMNTFGKKYMKKYQCTVCGYVYDPEVGDPDNGIKPGIPFEDLPDDWVCPLCGVGKEEFEPYEE